MADSQWQRAKALFELALRKRARDPRIDGVSSMTDQSDPQFSPARPSLSGRMLGRYRLREQIGSGGMGEAYLAHDERLNRLVAIKVIAPRLLDDDEARERFEREARAIAALSHPYICTLYDVGSVDGVEFLVMEHLEGETLAARLARHGERKPLSLKELLRIATQLADALTAAHHAGVVHRDLKPANVMLTGTGVARHGVPQVKVLDFGLAKLPALVPDERTTTARALTGVDTIVGTLPYMAPEQLQGQKIDARTDLFAFGAIVYEMASGRRAFNGDSQASLIAAILDREPEPLSDIQPTVPPGLDRLVRKCLAKDPDARWQSASDVADELRWIAAGPGSGASGQPIRTHRHRSRWIAIAGGLIVAVAAGAGIWNWRGDHRDHRPVQHRQVTFAGDVLAAAISPDGRSVAYAVGEQNVEIRVLVRDLAGGQTQPIWTGEYLWAVDWMPDGSHVMMSGRGGTWIVPRLGGSTRRVSDSLRSVASSPDGRHANLWRFDLAPTTEATPLTQGTPLFAYPRVSPDGQWIAARRGPESDPELVKIPIGGGEPVGLGEGTGPGWSADGQHLAFISRRSGSQRVWVARADGVRPEEVKDSAVGIERLVWLPDGRLAWPTPDNRNYRIRDLQTGRDEYLVKDDTVGWVFEPRFSPRGDQVALAWNRRMKRPHDPGMWLLSWPGREERRLTTEALNPIGWSADGEWIYAAPNSGRAVFRVSTRTGKTERVGQFPAGTFETDTCDLTPDRVAIICSLTEQKSDAWMMENFDTEIPTSRAGGM